ncbi:MAG: pyridoxamine 5'-phosphate oxidase family protein [Acidimicrobiales bacterium]
MASELFEVVSQAPDTGGPNRFTYWLATTNADGTPHVAAVGTLPIDGVLCVISGLGTRKSRNLARDPCCVLTVSTHRFDLVVEGAARIVTDQTRARAHRPRVLRPGLAGAG